MNPIDAVRLNFRILQTQTAYERACRACRWLVLSNALWVGAVIFLLLR